MHRADWVNMNDGSLDDLRAAVKAEFDRIVAARRPGTLPSICGPWHESFKAEWAKKREAEATQANRA